MRLTSLSVLLLLVLCGSAAGSDITSPTLTDVYFAPIIIDTSTGAVTVTVTVSGQDDLSGLRNFQMVFLSPDGHLQRGDSEAFAGTPLQGSATGSVSFPQYSQSGLWALQYVGLFDQVGNGTYLYTTDLASRGFNTTLTVVGNSDVTPPQLTAISFSPSAVDTSASSASVSVSVSGQDDMSGLRNFQLVFLSPDGHLQRGDSAAFSGDPMAGTATGSISFPQYSQSGAWSVQYLSIFDQVGNGATFSGHDLSLLGYGSELTILDTPEPSMSAVLGVLLLVAFKAREIRHPHRK